MTTKDDMDNYQEDKSYERGIRAALNRHPDCRDPEHPGCEFCEDKGEE